MSKTHIKKLIEFANKLDDLGLYREAIRIDGIMRDMKVSHDLYPDPKYAPIFNDILRILQSAHVQPEIIKTVLDLQKSKYMVPANLEEFTPESAISRFVPEEARAAALSYAQYYNSIQDLKTELEAAKTNEEKTSLQNEIDYEERELRDKWLKLMNYKKQSPQVFEAIREYIDYALQRDKQPPEVRLMVDRRKKDRRGK